MFCFVFLRILPLFFFLIYFIIYLWLCWIFVSMRGTSLVVASGGHSSSRCAGLSLSRPLLLWSTGSRRAGSVIVAHGPSCSAACGILPDQGLNRVPCIGRQTLNHRATREAPQGNSVVLLGKGNGFWVAKNYSTYLLHSSEGETTKP